MSPKPTISPLLDAIEADDYNWLVQNAPDYVDAIIQELGNGKDPEDIRRILVKELGPDRFPLVRRCHHAAMYLFREM